MIRQGLFQDNINLVLAGSSTDNLVAWEFVMNIRHESILVYK